MDFVAFDFETASPKRNSACSLALTVVQNNQVVDELYSLINPKTQFSPFNIQIHGITPDMVQNAPTFSELWPHIANFFTADKLVVAHNAPFDCSVLNKTLTNLEMKVPHFNVLDTVKTSKSLYANLGFKDNKLNTLCTNLGIDLRQHHNAMYDSRACAEILLNQLKEFGFENLKPFIKTYPQK